MNFTTSTKMCFTKTKPPIQVAPDKPSEPIVIEPEKPTTPTVQKEASPITVILGTAHLSSTPGKRSPDGTFREYEYSRKICKLVQQKLKSLGYKCVIDYEGADMPGLNSSQELVKRVGIVNNLCKELGSCIYVSIHVNAAGNGKDWLNATGWCIYTTKGVTKSDTLADFIYGQAKNQLTPLGKKLRTDFSDGDADQEENFYVILHTSCPAVLTENFFQDCKSDVAWLISDEGVNTIVNIHVQGIRDYLKSLS